jgi:hypothetical protein
MGSPPPLVFLRICERVIEDGLATRHPPTLAQRVRTLLTLRALDRASRDLIDALMLSKLLAACVPAGALASHRASERPTYASLASCTDMQVLTLAAWMCCPTGAGRCVTREILVERIMNVAHGGIRWDMLPLKRELRRARGRLPESWVRKKRL